MTDLVRSEVENMYLQMMRHNITGSELAKSAGVTRITLTNWRYGRTVPSLDKWLQVQNALETLIGALEIDKAK